jgi:phage terminase large subunit-like protein
VWLNRPVKSSGQAFDIGRWDEFAADQAVIPEAGRLIALGFDGSRTEDTTGIVGTDIETGYQWVVGFWDPNDRDQCPDGEVPVADVVETFHQTFETWTVVRLHAEPYHWRETIDNLAGIYGRDVVVARWSTQIRRSAFAIDAYIKAIMNGDVMHSGDQRMRAHLANAHKRSVEVKNPKTGRRMFLLCKDRDDSPRKIDLADAGWLSWEGAGVAIADGALTEGTYEAWAA